MALSLMIATVPSLTVGTAKAATETEPPSHTAYLVSQDLVASPFRLAEVTEGKSLEDSKPSQNDREPTPVVPQDQHYVWAMEAGISADQFPYVNYVVSHESGWRPDARNGKEGACGLVQALPCSKIPGDWTDPVNALKWGNSYVISRYGSWKNAVLWWQSHHWY